MRYIIFDLEWNQPSSQKEKNECLPHGEIIQIGFLVINDTLDIVHREDIIIRPVCYTVMHKYVSALTGITQDDIEGGTSFDLAIGRMAEFFDDETVIITWGDDDMPLIADNLKYHSMDGFELPKHCNLQRIFSAQTGTKSRQTGLKTAIEQLGIETDIKAHDALNDAYMTYLIAMKLDLPKGVADYDDLKMKTVDKSSQQPWNYEKTLYSLSIPFEGSPDALAAACRKMPVHCPDGGNMFEAGSIDIVRQGKLSFISECECPEHGSFFLRYELKNSLLTVKCYRLNEDFDRIYKNRLRQKEKKRVYRDNMRKSAKSGN